MTANTSPPGSSAGDATAGDPFDPSEPVVELGKVRVTSGVLALGVSTEHLATVLALHSYGLWGDVDEEDALANNIATVGGDGTRVLSSYLLPEIEGERHRVWVITDAENDEGVRESTVVTLPSEY